ncbi:MAG: dockerin type I domain-containing protein [Candidatus Hinthialibacter sp.]
MINLTRNIQIFLLFALFIAIAPASYSGANDEATFLLDFQTTENDSQTSSTIENSPEFVTVTVDNVTHTYFQVTLVLKGAVDLMGCNCDLVFDKSKLNVISIVEAQGDVNFDGRANIADVLTLAERFGQDTTSNGLSYFDLNPTGESANKIDALDIEALTPHINQKTLFWTSNPNADLSAIRESFEIFESPAVSNENGKIDDIVVVLLPRIHPTPEGFGFDGDARICDIIFEVVQGASGETTISFEDASAIDESTEITQTDIINGSVPKTQNSVVTLP